MPAYETLQNIHEYMLNFIIFTNLMGVSLGIQISFIIICYSFCVLIFQLAWQIQNTVDATNYLLIIRCDISEFSICFFMNHGTFCMWIMGQ